MIVVIPYADGFLRPETLRAAERWSAGLDVVTINVSGDDTAYWRMFRDLWAAGESIINIEQDIVVSPDTISTMRDCGHEWCGYSYNFGEHVGHPPALGCTQFSGALMDRHRDALEQAGEIWGRPGSGEPPGVGVPPKHWTYLDQRIEYVLGFDQVTRSWLTEQRRFRHEPAVRHLH